MVQSPGTDLEAHLPVPWPTVGVISVLGDRSVTVLCGLDGLYTRVTVGDDKIAPVRRQISAED